MHSRELIDLAGFVAAEGPVLLAGINRLTPDILGRYWSASKCRLERWTIGLRLYRDQPLGLRGPSESAWESVRPLCEEVFATEVLTRVWSSLMVALDAKLGANDAQPVAASVLGGHVEAANRVLELLSDGHVPPRSALKLNRVRRLCERWTDLLLGFLGAPGDVGQFAHDAERAGEFEVELAKRDRPVPRRQTWSVLSASLRGAFVNRLQGDTANADLNCRVAGSILACFPSELFDSSGAYRGLWMLRLSAATTDTQVLVEELLAADASNEAPAAFLDEGRTAGRRLQR